MPGGMHLGKLSFVVFGQQLLEPRVVAERIDHRCYFEISGRNKRRDREQMLDMIEGCIVLAEPDAALSQLPLPACDLE